MKHIRAILPTIVTFALAAGLHAAEPEPAATNVPEPELAR